MEELQKLIEQEMTIKEITEKLDLGIDAVKYRLKKYNLKTINGTNKSTTGVDKDKRRKRQVIYNNNRRQEFKKKSVEHLGGCCSKCGYSKCIKALEFHHEDPTAKEFTISKDSASRTWDKVIRELDKYILVCANCHREIHATDID